jgi:hypothetical protein
MLVWGLARDAWGTRIVARRGAGASDLRQVVVRQVISRSRPARGLARQGRSRASSKRIHGPAILVRCRPFARPSHPSRPGLCALGTYVIALGYSPEAGGRWRRGTDVGWIFIFAISQFLQLEFQAHCRRGHWAKSLSDKRLCCSSPGHAACSSRGIPIRSPSVSAPACPPHSAVTARLSLATRMLASVRGRLTVQATGERMWWTWAVMLMTPMLIAHPAAFSRLVRNEPFRRHAPHDRSKRNRFPNRTALI